MSRTRLAIASASTLAVAGGAVGVGCVLSAQAPVKYSLRSLISESKRNLLEAGSDFWNIKYSTYQRTFQKTNPLKLNPDSSEGLKKWCQETINEETELEKKDSSNYSITLQLCTRPTRTENLLKNNKTLVESGFWKAKALAYRAGKGKLAIPTIADYNLVSDGEIEKAIENWCKETVEQEIEKIDSTDQLTEQWCANG